MRKWQLTIRWVTVAVALLAAGAMPRMADASANESYRVFVADLDLQSASGVDVLYSRLQTAARAVCGFDQARGYAERQHARRCIGATLDAIVEEVGRDASLSGMLRAQHRAARYRVIDSATAEWFVSSVN